MMPVPGSPGAPHFKGSNVTEFLERYHDLCDDVGLNEPERIKRLPRYCSMLVGQYIKCLPQWAAKDASWDDLEKRLKKEYWHDDAFQRTNSRVFLEILKSTPREMEDVGQYIRTFTAISAVLVHKRELDEYTRGIWFLNGLPRDVRAEVIEETDVNLERPESFDFAKMSKTAKEIIAFDAGCDYFLSDSHTVNNPAII